MRKRRRRLVLVVAGVAAAGGLVLSGVGLGTVSATVIGMSKLADLQKSGGGEGGAPPGAGAPGPGGEQAAAGKPGQAPGAGAEAPGAKAGDEAKPGDGPGSAEKDAPATLGVEVADDSDGRGALVTAVHIPGPGYTAGLVRGDVLTRFGDQEIRSAGDLARAVDEIRPGERVQLTVLHEDGTSQPLSAVPGVMT